MKGTEMKKIVLMLCFSLIACDGHATYKCHSPEVKELVLKQINKYIASLGPNGYPTVQAISVTNAGGKDNLCDGTLTGTAPSILDDRIVTNTIRISYHFDIVDIEGDDYLKVGVDDLISVPARLIWDGNF
jgi:hypothetical protein